MLNGHMYQAARMAFYAMYPHWYRLPVWTTGEQRDYHDFMGAYLAGGEL